MRLGLETLIASHVGLATPETPEPRHEGRRTDLGNEHLRLRGRAMGRASLPCHAVAKKNCTSATNTSTSPQESLSLYSRATSYQ